MEFHHCRDLVPLVPSWRVVFVEEAARSDMALTENCVAAIAHSDRPRFPFAVEAIHKIAQAQGDCVVGHMAVNVGSCIHAARQTLRQRPP